MLGDAQMNSLPGGSAIATEGTHPRTCQEVQSLLQDVKAKYQARLGVTGSRSGDSEQITATPLQRVELLPTVGPAGIKDIGTSHPTAPKE